MKKTKWVHRETGNVKEAFLSINMAAQHGYVPYQEPVIEQLITDDAQELYKAGLNELDHEEQLITVIKAKLHPRKPKTK